MTPSPQAPETLDRPAALPTGPGGLSRWARIALVVYWPMLAVGTHWPNLSIPAPPPHPLQAVLQIDKLAHLVGFGGLMALVLLSGIIGAKRDWQTRCTWALWTCLCYAVADELSQGLLGGRRTVSVSDLVANAIAILSVYLIARQPRQQNNKQIPRWILWPLLLTIPLIIGGFLSREVMGQLVSLKRDLIAPGTLPLRRLDHLTHGVIAFGVSVVAISLLRIASRRPRRATFIALLVLLGSGPVIEIMQFYTGRGVEAKDVLGHSIGVLIAMVCWAIWPMQPSPAAVASTAPQSTNDPDADTSRAFVGHAVLVSLLTLLSRFAGLARDAVLAAALGLSAAADAFFIGFLVPNLFRRLFGEGALTAAFIPNYTDLLERDPALAKRFATLTLTLLSVVLVAITIVGELILWWVASSIDDSQKVSLAIKYTRLMLPYMPLICAVAFIGGILQVHKRFGPPAAAPLVLNGVILAAVLLSTGMFQRDTTPDVVATWVALSVLAAGAIQLYWQAAVLARVTGLSTSFKDAWPTMRSMLIMMGPMVLGLAVFQINALLDALIAFFFAPAEVGAGVGSPVTLFGQTFDAPLRNGDVAALSWSQRLYQFPLGVFGIAIATAIFPALSAAAAKFNTEQSDDLDNVAEGADRAKPQAASGEFARIVRHGLRLTVFIALPASAGLILVRIPLARTVFEHGSFTTSDAVRVSVILAGYAASVWAYSMTHTLTRAFYALKDATTPLKVSAAMVLLNLTLNLSLIWSLGAAGLAWSTAISAAGQVVLLVLLIRKRVDRPIDASVLGSWARSILATLVMSAVLFGVTAYIDPLLLTWKESATLLAGMVAVGMSVYFIIGRLSKAEELTWLMRKKV